MSDPPAVDLAPLQAMITGEVVTPADSHWDAARRAWNLVADQRPALVIVADGVDDVAATVRDRLARVTAAYDPDGLFVANQVAG